MLFNLAIALLALGFAEADYFRGGRRGRWFDHYVLVILENREITEVTVDPTFTAIAAFGQLQSNYFGVSHPSQPNYWAMVAGDYIFPGNTFVAGTTTPVSNTNTDASIDVWSVPTLADLFDAARVDYKTYSENYPTSGQCSVVASNGVGSVSYKRKHNPFISFQSFYNSTARCATQKDFNDLNLDLASGNLPAFTIVAPNQIDDGHDSDVPTTAKYVAPFLKNLTSSPLYKSSRVLVHIVYDESESSQNNNIYSVILGTALPASSVGTIDTTSYNHYSIMATVEANWHLGNLGKNDVIANAFPLGYGSD